MRRSNPPYNPPWRIGALAHGRLLLCANPRQCLHRRIGALAHSGVAGSVDQRPADDPLGAPGARSPAAERGQTPLGRQKSSTLPARYDSEPHAHDRETVEVFLLRRAALSSAANRSNYSVLREVSGSNLRAIQRNPAQRRKTRFAELAARKNGCAAYRGPRFGDFAFPPPLDRAGPARRSP